jgi:RIP homotypic interaction motif
MDPVTLIVTALAAGAAAALQDGVKDTVKNAYKRLRDSAKKLLAGHPDGELALERHETTPGKWEGILKSELADTGADHDTDLIGAAEALMRLLDEAGARSGKYHVTIHGGQGIQIGDGNTQTNTFRA